jgi:5-methylthioadenosine/S-adenosylhomocysteine deaminase
MKKLITNVTIITMDRVRRIIPDGYIAIEKDRITAVGSMGDSGLKQDNGFETIDAKGKYAIPGLINTHTHLFQGLLKGLGDDRVLVDWFNQVTAPSATQLTEEDCYIAAKLGIVESIKSGATTLLDFMYPHHKKGLSEPIIQAFLESNLRGVYARGFIDAGTEYGIPQALVEKAEEVLVEVEALHSKYNQSNNGKLRIWLAPCMIWSHTLEAFMATKELSRSKNIPISIHVAETDFELKTSLERFGKKDLDFLESIGFLGDDVLAVHCVHLDDRDLRILKAYDVKVSHNPVSNMYLSSGVAPVPAMLRQGITVGLATDGPASNNNQNMIASLKFASLLHKVYTGDPTSITAEKVLEMATLDGAAALGWKEDLGSIEKGKKADLCLLNFENAFTVPVHHPVSTLVYSAIGNEVESVLVDGEFLMKDRRLVHIDEQKIYEEARKAAEKLAQRAGTWKYRERKWRSTAS